MSPPIVLLVGVFVLAAVLGPLIALRQLDAASTAQQRLSGARDDLEAVLRTQLNEEAALRGYLATGLIEYLDDADAPPAPAFDRALGTLRSAVEGLPQGTALVEDLGRAHHDWEADVALPLLRRPKETDPLARQARGKLLTDQMRLDAATLRTRLDAADAEVAATLRRRIDATVAISAGGVALFALVAVALAAGRAAAVDRLERERTLVDALQRTLRVTPVAPRGAVLGQASVSATTEALVGGDLLDAWPAQDGGGWYAVADVSGKGIGAARQAAFVQYALRALASEDDDPGSVVARFNALFLDTFEDPTSFVVLFLARVDGRGETLRYASAGHGCALLRRAGRVRTLAPTGPIVGLERASPFGSERLALRPGDLLLVATDGLTEAKDPSGELLGDAAVARLVAEGPREPQALCDALVATVRERAGGEVTDDLAVLALGVVPLAFPALR